MPSRNDGCVTDGKQKKCSPPSFSPSWITLIDPRVLSHFVALQHKAFIHFMTLSAPQSAWPSPGRSAHCPGEDVCVLTHRARPLRDAFPASGTSDSSEERSHWGNPCKSTSYLLTHCQPIIIFYKCLLFVKNIKIEFHKQGKDTAMILEWHLTFLQ